MGRVLALYSATVTRHLHPQPMVQNQRTVAEKCANSEVHVGRSSRVLFCFAFERGRGVGLGAFAESVNEMLRRKSPENLRKGSCFFCILT